MWGIILEGAILGLDFVYHRWLAPKPPPSKIAGQAIQLPRTDFGGPIPLVFGWTNVKAPFLAFINVPKSVDIEDGSSTLIARGYSIDMMFVVGIPMGSGYTHGARTTPGAPHLTRVWYGDKSLTCPTPGGLPFANAGTFDGQYVIQENLLGGTGGGGGLIGAYYWFGGWKDQRFNFPSTPIGDAMEAKALPSRGDSLMFGGLPNQMCIAFCGSDLGYDSITNPDPNPTSIDVPVPDTGFYFGESPNISAISVEVKTYGDAVSGITQHIFSMNNPGTDFQGDADPAEVIYCILTDPFGKLGLDPALVDLDSFMAASTTLKAEGFGYSRAFETGMGANEMIQDVLRTIDGALGFNRASGKLTLTLIRNDYDPTTARQIDKTNCKELRNVSIGGPTGVPNKIKVNYPDRSKGYATIPATAQNLANAVGQDGLVVEKVITFDGVKLAATAQMIAERELAAVSRPMIKCTAIVNRSFLDMNVGQVVKLTWQGPDISGLIFRIAAVTVGAPSDATIQLDLIQDAFYVWSDHLPVNPVFGGHGAGGVDGISRG